MGRKGRKKKENKERQGVSEILLESLVRWWDRCKIDFFFFFWVAKLTNFAFTYPVALTLLFIEDTKQG